MIPKDTSKKNITPIVKITLLNYNPVMQDEYSKKFMSSLIEGLLKRRQLAQAE
jgi:hypothetical protein